MLSYRLSLLNRVACAILVVVGLLFLGGCGSGGYSGPTGTVSGTVTLNDQPVPDGCLVTFVAEPNFTATGIVESGGSYQLSTVDTKGNRSDDIPAATYSVSVSSPPQAEFSQEDYDKMMEESATGGAQPVAGEEVIPVEFQSSGTSGLSYEVTTGANIIDIDLK